MLTRGIFDVMTAHKFTRFLYSTEVESYAMKLPSVLGRCPQHILRTNGVLNGKIITIK